MKIFVELSLENSSNKEMETTRRYNSREMISQAEFMYVIEQGIAISNHDYRCDVEHANVYITARRKRTIRHDALDLSRIYGLVLGLLVLVFRLLCLEWDGV